MALPDVTALSDADLATLLANCYAEQSRRDVLSSAKTDLDNISSAFTANRQKLVSQYQDALGRKDGDPWVQPTGALDAYPKGAQVTHGSKTWSSNIDANVWEPGVSSWSEVTAPGTLPEWVQPSGATDAYAEGAQVVHNGHTWTSLVDANVWEPSAAVPTLWKDEGASS